MKPIIIDNFLENPHEHRNSWVNSSDKAINGYPYHDYLQKTNLKRDAKKIEQQISNVIGKECRLFQRDYSYFSYFSDNPFNLTLNHHDGVGVYPAYVYLTLPEYIQEGEGTNMLEYKITKNRKKSETDENLMESYPLPLPVTENLTPQEAAYYASTDHFNMKNWEVWQHIPMKFNRLVIIEGDYWHKTTRNFGTTRENVRLIELFHFSIIGEEIKLDPKHIPIFR